MARDTLAIARLWREYERELVELWITGWEPEHKFADWEWGKPGKRGTRPAGWWKHCAPVPRRRGDSEATYLDRHELWLPGEREAYCATLGVR